jgi:hypothetical protein
MPDRVTTHIPSFPLLPDCAAKAHELTFRRVVRQVHGETPEGSPTVYDERELIEFARRCPNSHIFATAIGEIVVRIDQNETLVRILRCDGAGVRGSRLHEVFYDAQQEARLAAPRLGHCQQVAVQQAVGQAHRDRHALVSGLADAAGRSVQAGADRGRQRQTPTRGRPWRQSTVSFCERRSTAYCVDSLAMVCMSAVAPRSLRWTRAARTRWSWVSASGRAALQTECWLQ